MDEQMFQVVITGSGEVRDKDGKLISTEPVEGRMVVNAEQAALIQSAFNEGNQS